MVNLNLLVPGLATPRAGLTNFAMWSRYHCECGTVAQAFPTCSLTTPHGLQYLCFADCVVYIARFIMPCIGDSRFNCPNRPELVSLKWISRRVAVNFASAPFPLLFTAFVTPQLWQHLLRHCVCTSLSILWANRNQYIPAKACPKELPPWADRLWLHTPNP